ncbi:MAG: cyclopropane-fatty-acyl-phospholipid synthase family protein [Pseudomonadota bacterium]
MTAQGVRGEQLLSGGERFGPEPGFFARLIAPGFGKILDRIDAGLERGSLIGHLPDGTTRMLGGRAPGFEAEVWLKDWRALLRLATNGTIGWYQAYDAGEWDSNDMTAMFAVMSDNVRSLGGTARSSGPFRWAAALAHRFNRNDKAGSRRNIAAHYDLGNDFYAAWLDPSMTYSSGLACGEDGLEAAQQLKLEAMAERVGNPGTVLEIGCGWGSMAEHLAQRGAEVTAISLSDEQLAFARQRRDRSIDFRKQDYRDVAGQFDAIVSVEMVEALGREYWPAFMDCVASNLKPGGRAALQYISIEDDLFETYAGTADFIQAYIFPGGLLIKSPEFRELVEKRGFNWEDETRFGPDYAETLRLWHERFETAVEQGRLPDGFDDRFVRLWRYYLTYCEAGFRTGNIDVHQVTLVKQ